MGNIVVIIILLLSLNLIVYFVVFCTAVLYTFSFSSYQTFPIHFYWQKGWDAIDVVALDSAEKKVGYASVVTQL